ncbi:MAG: WbqC family protein [Gammaproteobacteria bacterium]
MIITTHQPIFLPWPGFFYKLLRADTMVLLDQVQFPFGRSWMNRNRLKCDQGELWLTVPVWKKGKGKQLIRDVEICNETDWRRRHLRGLRQLYGNAPYRDDYLPKLESVYIREHCHLIDLNLDVIRVLWDALGLKRRLVLQSELGVSGRGTELLVSICRAMNADTYVTLPIVEKYLDTEKFQTSNIRLEFARFSPPVYPQLWGDFRYNLSVLDLLLNCGPKSLKLIAQNKANKGGGFI